MEHRTFRVVGVTLVQQYTLRIRFDDDSERPLIFLPSWKVRYMGR